MVTGTVRQKYTWGQNVKVKSNAPIVFRPNQDCSICGIRTIETEKTSKVIKESVGSHLYLVEFSDGYSVEIPDRFLESN